MAALFVLTFAAFQRLLTHEVGGEVSDGRHVLLWLIPPASAVVAWQRRCRLSRAIFRCSRFGIAAIIAGLLLHFWSETSSSRTLDAVAFLLTLAGIVLAIWGRAVFAVMWPVLLLSVFLLPMKQMMPAASAGFLQQAGADESAWYLQAFGQPAVARGTSILTPTATFGVEQVFPGIQVVLLCLATAAILAAGSTRSYVEKFLMVFSAVPFALLLLTSHIVLFVMTFEGSSPSGDAVAVPSPNAFLIIGLTAVLVFVSFQLFDRLFQEAQQTTPKQSRAETPAGIMTVVTGFSTDTSHAQSGAS